MATADTMSKEWESAKQSPFNCSICLGDFLEPKVLLCGHTFCKTCLEDLLKQGIGLKTTFNCPKCRSRVNLPDSNSIDDFPTNYDMIGVMESTLVQNLCPQHKKSQDLFCVTCDESICVECFEQAHKPGKSIDVHDVRSASVPASKSIERLRSTAEKLQHSQQQELLERIAKLEEKHTQDIGDLISKIRQKEEQMIQEIKRQADDLVKVAEIVAKEEQEQLDDIKNKLEKDHAEQIGRADMCLSLANEISHCGLSQSRYEKSKSLIHSGREALRSHTESMDSSVEQLNNMSDTMTFCEHPENNYIIIGKLMRQSAAEQSSVKYNRKDSKLSLRANVQNKFRKFIYSK